MPAHPAPTPQPPAPTKALAKADLESLLRTRKLDQTLTTALPSALVRDEALVASTGIGALDARLDGGFPRGQLSELVGPRSSGRTSVTLQSVAAATAPGEPVAPIDALAMPGGRSGGD